MYRSRRRRRETGRKWNKKTWVSAAQTHTYIQTPRLALLRLMWVQRVHWLFEESWLRRHKQKTVRCANDSRFSLWTLNFLRACCLFFVILHFTYFLRCFRYNRWGLFKAELWIYSQSSVSITSLCFFLSVFPTVPLCCSTSTFQLEEKWNRNMTMRHFFYFCRPNSSRLLNTGWEDRIKWRSRRASGCYEMEVTRSSLLCGSKQRRTIVHPLCVPPFFIISNTTLCLSS